MLSLFLICMQENALLYLQELPELFCSHGRYDLCDHTAQKGRVADLTVRQMLIMAAFSLYFGLQVKAWIT